MVRTGRPCVYIAKSKARSKQFRFSLETTARTVVEMLLAEGRRHCVAIKSKLTAGLLTSVDATLHVDAEIGTTNLGSATRADDQWYCTVLERLRAWKI